MKVDELFASDDISWLQNPDEVIEAEQLERKSSLDRNVANAVSAIANGARGGGLVVVGVQKTGAVRAFSAAEIDSELHALRQRLPIFWNRVETRKVPAGDKYLLFIKVPYAGDRVVVLDDGTAYRRIGTSSVALNADEIRELRYQRREARWEVEPAMPFDPTVLDGELCERFQKALRSTGREQPLEQDLENEQLAVRRNDGLHLSNAGLLVLGRQPWHLIRGAEVRFLRFEGLEERFGSASNVVKDERFVGPLPTQLRAAIDFVSTQVRKFEALGPKGTFDNLPEYPKDAWEEAIVNAVVHRSYSLEAQTLIKMFDDRLVVRSPGGFPPYVSAEDLLKSTLSSQPRNPVVMEALFKFDFVKRRSEGHQRINEEMTARGLPKPAWREDPDRRLWVDLTLRNDYAQIAANRDGDAEEWQAVFVDLAEKDIGLLRARGVAAWVDKDRLGKRAPETVQRLGFEIFLDASAPARLVEQLGYLLRRASPRLSEEALRPVVFKVLSGVALRTEVAVALADLTARIDALADDVLYWLGDDNRPRAPESANDWAFVVLKLRVQRDPLPERGWLHKALQISARTEYRGLRSASELNRVLRGA